MRKVSNGRGIKVDLASADVVGQLKFVGGRLGRIQSKVAKDGGGFEGVLNFDGETITDKKTGAGSGQDWGMLDALYWDNSASEVTKTASGNTLCGYATKVATSVATEGTFLLNGLPAISGD